MREKDGRNEIYIETLALRRNLELVLCEKGLLAKDKTDFLGPVDVSTSITKYTGLCLENWKEKIRIKTTGNETIPEDTNFIMVSSWWESEDGDKIKPIVKYRIGKAPGEILKFGFIGMGQYVRMINDYKPIDDKDLRDAIGEIGDILKKAKQ